MRKHGKKQRYLSAMVALWLLAGGTAAAERDHQVISYDGHPVFDLIYFGEDDAGTWVEKFWTESGTIPLCYDFPQKMKSWLNDACYQWAEVLKPGLSDMKKPAQLIVGGSNQINASGTDNDAEKENTPDYFRKVLMSGADIPYIDFTDKAAYDSRGYDGFGIINLGQGLGADDGSGTYGWTGDNKSQLTHSSMGVDLPQVMFHEIAHALGIAGYTVALPSNTDSDVRYNSGYRFGTQADDPLEFTGHFLDQKGNKAQSGQTIVLMDDPRYTAEELEYINGHPEKYFQLASAAKLNYNTADGRAFFAGEHVSEVLDGRKFWGLDAIPVNTENNNLRTDDPAATYEFELSHIDLERSLMSHQSYRSYVTFMEAELAVMQDIGYKIDRKNFYGKSIYNNSATVLNTQGFFARNDAGTDYINGKTNTATYGVGLHLYGSKNNVLQTSGGKNDGSADLLAGGTGAAGIRVDGIENNVTLAADASIEANGQNGTGILVAYGRDHNVNVAGNVSAMGDGGDGIRFDFGSGMGQTVEYRGSYIRYKLKTLAEIKDTKGVILDDDDMKLADSENTALKEGIDDGGVDGTSFTDHVDGDLGSKMGSLTILGSVAGKSHAIYMDKSAFVDNIDIEKGAKITGNIVSDWKHYDHDIYGQKDGDNSKLKIQYGDKSHFYDEYCKDLVTNLNINGDFAYSGNITGTDNMKLKVNDGATMAYTGTADVVGVQVAKGASLYGGNYKVNEIEKYASFETKDDEAGKLINHGTIGALDGDSTMEIDGNLESDGTLLGQAGGENGGIVVSGTANLKSGSKVSGDMGINGESVSVLQADGGITGADNVAGQQRGLLNYNASFSEDGKSLTAIAQAKESLDGASSQQAADYENINSKALGYVGTAGAENELRSFYALDTDAKALQAIDEIGTNDKEDSTTAIVSAQSSSLNGRVLSSRLATAMGQAPAMLHIGTAYLADGSSDGVDVPVKLTQEQDYSAWAKFGRNWGNTAGGSNYTGNTYTFGYDWRHGDNQRNGWFASYTDSSYGHSDGSENLQDTRLGYYTGISKGADTMLLYGDFGYLDGSRSRMANIGTLGTSNLVKGDYTGWLVELGGEWKHALHEPGTKTWQVSPYGAMQMSYMKQNGYRETGSIKAYDVSSGHNFYSALEGGVEFSRYMPKGSLNFRLGLRQALSGTDYAAHENSIILGRGYSKSSSIDKTHFVTSLAVETELAPCWQLGAEVAFQKGAHDKDLMANVQLRWLW